MTAAYRPCRGSASSGSRWARRRNVRRGRARHHRRPCAAARELSGDRRAAVAVAGAADAPPTFGFDEGAGAGTAEPGPASRARAPSSGRASQCRGATPIAVAGLCLISAGGPPEAAGEPRPPMRQTPGAAEVEDWKGSRSRRASSPTEEDRGSAARCQAGASLRRSPVRSFAVMPGAAAGVDVALTCVDFCACCAPRQGRGSRGRGRRGWHRLRGLRRQRATGGAETIVDEETPTLRAALRRGRDPLHRGRPPARVAGEWPPTRCARPSPLPWPPDRTCRRCRVRLRDVGRSMTARERRRP